MAMTLTTRNDGGPALLLIHGFPLDRRLWDAVVSKLPSTMTILLPDLPGMGGSPVDPKVRTIDDYARALLSLLDDRKVARFFVAGHSMGGYIALAMLRLAPERVAGIALVSSRALPDTDEGRKTRETNAQRAEKEGPGFLVATMPEKAAGTAPPPGVIETLRTIMGASNGPGVAAALRAMASRPDATPSLGRIACPAVVFAGRQDQIVPAAESEAMAKAIPGAKLVWCETSGHVPMLEQPDLVARELAALVK
jgi:pimeloyl-ACP methyl ester carboxylesterase